MADSTEPTVPEDLAHRILARAAELDTREGPTVPLARLREIALETGISTAAVDHAIRELSGPKPPTLFGRIWRRVATAVNVSPLGPLSTLTLNVLAFAGAWILISLSTRLVAFAGGNWVITYGVAIIANLVGLGMAVRARARLTATLLAIVAAAQLAEYPVRLLYGMSNAVPEVALMLAAGFGLLLSRTLATRAKDERGTPPALADAASVTPPQTETDSPSDYTTLRLRPVSPSPAV